MKKVYILIAIGIAALIGYIVILQRVKSLKYDLGVAIGNEKAALAENDSLKNNSIAYQLTIEQLEQSNDSIVERLNQARKSLKIKDNRIKELAYLATEASKSDTIVVRDTIFRDTGFALDTTIGDKWYQCNIGLRYPNIIAVSPKFISEKSVIVSSRKETIFPPKKCWLARLFQKKHTLVEVDITEESPYIETTQSKFIKIIE